MGNFVAVRRPSRGRYGKSAARRRVVRLAISASLDCVVCALHRPGEVAGVEGGAVRLADTNKK